MQASVPLRAGRNAATLVAGAAALLGGFTGGLALTRNLYEALFPQALWLALPMPALAIAAAVAAAAGLAWLALARRFGPAAPAAPFLALLLNGIYLFEPAVDLSLGRFLFAASLWLEVALWARLFVAPARWRWLGVALLLLLLAPIYLLTLGQNVGAADTFEFQVVVPQLGIVHPTGYPLYLLLSRPFVALPFGTVAWRVNLGTALFGLAAAAVLYWLLLRLARRPIAALLGAAVFGLSPTFWSQATAAEVYALHALIVAAALLLMRELGAWALPAASPARPGTAASLDPYTATLLLAAVLGLGLTNHLTTAILLPLAAFAVFFAWRAGRYGSLDRRPVRVVLAAGLAFLLPLLLYLYLPLRWQAVNGEPMGLGRFVDWVVGGRFQGALQPAAWLRDPARYAVVGRLFLAEWPLRWIWPPVLLGVGWLFRRTRPFAIILIVTWLGYVFYALNYYVPDLSVFLIPAHLVVAVLWAAGLAAAAEWLARARPPGRRLWTVAVWLLAAAPLLAAAAARIGPAAEQAASDGGARWAAAVLDLPLAPDGAILADSARFPPLYYRQQAEGQRPDLDIVLLPDEAAYRAELDARLAAGQSAYLARYLPGLEGVYHLRSLGPLVEASLEPLAGPPGDLAGSGQDFGPARLLGYDLELPSPYAPGEAAVTLYWQAGRRPEEVLWVYRRWAGEGYEGPAAGQHPAGNRYPTVAWRPGEVVADFHALPLPLLDGPRDLALQVALAPPFTPPAELAWQDVATVPVDPAALPWRGRPLRAQIGPLLLAEVRAPAQVRPAARASAAIRGYAAEPERLALTLSPSGAAMRPAGARPRGRDEPLPPPFAAGRPLDTDRASGRYVLVASAAGEPAVCGWLRRPSAACIVGTVEISGAPLPDGATNFADQIALRAVDLPETTLIPGGVLAVNLTWQGLTNMAEDYTVFVQVLDAADRIVGQVDSWPLQGTFPTSQWRPGQVVADPYEIRLRPDLLAGPYRLHVGWYLLRTQQRLHVLDDSGAAVDDKVEIAGLVVR